MSGISAAPTSWTVITPSVNQGRFLGWSKSDVVLAVQNLQLNFRLSINDDATFSAIVQSLSTLPTCNPGVRRLRIRLEFHAQILGPSDHQIVENWTARLQAALRGIHWDHPVAVQVALNDQKVVANTERVHRTTPTAIDTARAVWFNPGNWEPLYNTTPAVLHPKDRTAPILYPDPNAAWTVVHSGWVPATGARGWVPQDNNQEQGTIQYLQIENLLAYVDQMDTTIDLTLLTDLPILFPTITFLRIRIDFDQQLSIAAKACIAEWLYLRLYPTLQKLHWSHRVEVLLALNDQHTPNNTEAFDAEAENASDVASALLQSPGHWQPVFTTTPATPRTPGTGTLVEDGSSRTTVADANMPPHDAQARYLPQQAPNQHRRPLAPDYVWASDKSGIPFVAVLDYTAEAAQSLPALATSFGALSTDQSNNELGPSRSFTQATNGSRTRPINRPEHDSAAADDNEQHSLGEGTSPDFTRSTSATQLELDQEVARQAQLAWNTESQNSPARTAHVPAGQSTIRPTNDNGTSQCSAPARRPMPMQQAIKDAHERDRQARKDDEKQSKNSDDDDEDLIELEREEEDFGSDHGEDTLVDGDAYTGGQKASLQEPSTHQSEIEEAGSGTSAPTSAPMPTPAMDLSGLDDADFAAAHAIVALSIQAHAEGFDAEEQHTCEEGKRERENN